MVAAVAHLRVIDRVVPATGEIIILRRYLRHRETLVQEAATCIQHIQRALTEMNLQLANVISDISGTTGSRILHAIVEGSSAIRLTLYSQSQVS